MASTPCIFLGYAPADAKYVTEMSRHLRPLQDRGVIRVFHEGCISAGEDAATALRSYQDCADVIVLLVSADLLASCMPLVRRAEILHWRRRIPLIPVLISSVSLHDTVFEGLKSVPASGDWASAVADREAIWVEFIEQLEERLALPQGFLAPPLAAPVAPMLPVLPGKSERAATVLASLRPPFGTSTGLVIYGILAMICVISLLYFCLQKVDFHSFIQPNTCENGFTPACVQQAKLLKNSKRYELYWKACEQLINKDDCQSAECVAAGAIACVEMGDHFLVCQNCQKVGDPNCGNCVQFLDDKAGNTCQDWKHRAKDAYHRACRSRNSNGCTKEPTALLRTEDCDLESTK